MTDIFTTQDVTLYAADGTLLLGQKPMAQSIPVVFPSDQTIPVTIGNDSWQFAASQGRAFVSTFSQLNISGTAATPIFLLKNPSGSTKNVRIWRTLIMSSANSTFWQVYRNPTITTNGTALAIQNLKLSGPASVVTAFSSPTISANGTLMISTQYGGSSIAPQSVLEFELAPFVEQNENLLLVAANSQNNKPVDLTFWFSEEAA
jgi:hypothetical protein